MSKGLSRDRCLHLIGMTKHQFYYKRTGRKSGAKLSDTTIRKVSEDEEIEVDNKDVVSRIVELKLDPDESNWYKMLSSRLQLEGYYINHKKVYRLMQEYVLLEERQKYDKKERVLHKRVCPLGPLEVLEMDIKYIKVDGTNKYAYILTIIDTFTRYVLAWDVGYSMRTKQVIRLWEKVIIEYLQEKRWEEIILNVEIRSDNGRQFSSKDLMSFFEENGLKKVFTHPYSPEENGHIESFHSILSKALKRDRFEQLGDVEARLVKFYETYNNKRNHGSIAGLSPATFWSLWELGKITSYVNNKKERNFIVNCMKQDIAYLEGVNKYEYRVA